VAIHQLVGGVDRNGRGGAEAVPYGEWGGQNADGSEGFAQHRKDWATPIHSLLRKYGVNLVLHGHDHLYAQQSRDGVTYQAVPQPAHRGESHSAAEYGYRSGTIDGRSGYLRFDVSATRMQVDYLAAPSDFSSPCEPDKLRLLHRYKIEANAQ